MNSKSLGLNKNFNINLIKATILTIVYLSLFYLSPLTVLAENSSAEKQDNPLKFMDILPKNESIPSKSNNTPTKNSAPKVIIDQDINITHWSGSWAGISNKQKFEMLIWPREVNPKRNRLHGYVYFPKLDCLARISISARSNNGKLQARAEWHDGGRRMRPGNCPGIKIRRKSGLAFKGEGIIKPTISNDRLVYKSKNLDINKSGLTLDKKQIVTLQRTKVSPQFADIIKFIKSKRLSKAPQGFLEQALKSSVSPKLPKDFFVKGDERIARYARENPLKKITKPLNEWVGSWSGKINGQEVQMVMWPNKQQPKTSLVGYVYLAKSDCLASAFINERNRGDNNFSWISIFNKKYRPDNCAEAPIDPKKGRVIFNAVGTTPQEGNKNEIIFNFSRINMLGYNLDKKKTEKVMFKRTKVSSKLANVINTLVHKDVRKPPKGFIAALK